mmetsp:Transcript_12397/g.37230  ORF Transcript_12397/g.37230 Transcript_12397/m.37230 type:complete len:260 (+) Transcript_12397:2797-3576(+)
MRSTGALLLMSFLAVLSLSRRLLLGGIFRSRLALLAHPLLELLQFLRRHLSLPYFSRLPAVDEALEDRLGGLVRREPRRDGLGEHVDLPVREPVHPAVLEVGVPVRHRLNDGLLEHEDVAEGLRARAVVAAMDLSLVHVEERHLSEDLPRLEEVVVLLVVVLAVERRQDEHGSRRDDKTLQANVTVMEHVVHREIDPRLERRGDLVADVVEVRRAAHAVQEPELEQHVRVEGLVDLVSHVRGHLLEEGEAVVHAAAGDE